MTKINRKTFLQHSFAAVANLYFSLNTSASAKITKKTKNKRPNILVILTDQERSWTDLPEDLALPRRKEFARTALSFNQYHGNVVACGPSRSVIYTGQHIQKTEVFDNPGMAPGRKDLDPDKTPTIGTMLKSLGYQTAYVGKWHLHGFGARERDNLPSALKRFGFDEFFPPTANGDTDGAAWEGARQDAAAAKNTANWFHHKSASADNEPWFMAVNLINPHDIRHLDATGDQAKSIHPQFGSDLTALPDAELYQTDLGYPLSKSFPGKTPRPVPAHSLYIEDATYFRGRIPHDDVTAWQKFQNYYFNCLRDVDTHIGTILDNLDTAGFSDDTIVIFTSDHGEMAGAHGMRGKGPFLFKENFHLPLLIRHPDLAAGHSTDKLACSVDLAPTILAAAGMNEKEQKKKFPALKGQNLLTVGEDNNRAASRDGILFMSNVVHCCNPDKKRHIIETLYARDRGEAFSPFKFPDDFVNLENRSFLRGYFDGRYKFGRYFRPNQHHIPLTWENLIKYNDIELYDTVTDPDEMHNLASDKTYKSIILDLNSKLNLLMEKEAGNDLGNLMPGPAGSWTLTSM